MELSEFNSHFLSDLLKKVSFENKAIVLSGDFNANLLKYDIERDVSDFLDLMYVNTLLPQITTLSRITAKSATPIDNIFANQFDPSFISGNLTISLSDHLAQFLMMPSFKKTQNVANGSPKYHRDMKNIDKNKDSISTLLKQTDWDKKLEVNLNNANNSTELLLNSVNEILDRYCPLKKISNSQKKSQNKPWITQGILKSIAVKSRLHRKRKRMKDITRKTELEEKVRYYKNNLLKITRTSKANRYNNFFKENKLNLLKTWDGISEIINIKKKETNYVTSLKLNDNTITDSQTIANTFNNHFTSIAKNIEQNLITSKSKYYDYLKDSSQQTFFLSPTNEQEVLTTIKQLKRNKAFGTSSTPTKFLKLFQNQLSKPISLIINLSFSTGTFPVVLKTLLQKR